MEPASNIRIRVAAVILSDDKLLLIAHKKGDDIYWLLPGGGVDYGESLTEALKRELLEELNVDVHVSGIALISDSIDPLGGRHVLNICFYCDIRGGELKLGLEDRLHDFAFFSRSEIGELIIHPPINDNLLDVFNRSEECIYVGKVWGE